MLLADTVCCLHSACPQEHFKSVENEAYGIVQGSLPSSNHQYSSSPSHCIAPQSEAPGTSTPVKSEPDYEELHYYY